METTAKTHPILIIAAISVILFSLVSIGAVTGLIPSSHSERNTSAAVAPVAPVSQAASNEKLALTSPTASSEAIPQAALEPKSTGSTHSDARDTERPTVKTHTHTHTETHVNKTKIHTEPKHHTHTAVKTVPAKHVSSHKESVVAANEIGQARDLGSAPVRTCSNCGVIESVNAVKEPGQGTPLGAIAGGVIGGLLGHQVGKGNGNTVATVAGAAGGAYAGHEIEKRVRSTSSWDVTVRMDNGDVRRFNLPQQPGYLPGDKVKVVDGQIVNG